VVYLARFEHNQSPYYSRLTKENFVMDIPTYKDKVFIVDSADARLRRADDLSRAEVYQNGDALPPGAQVGDIKRLPRRTSIRVTDTRTDSARKVYVFAEPIDAASGIPSGWTIATNLEGLFLNEITAWSPADMQAPPGRNNFTVIDRNALIREGPPNFRAASGSIPFGTFVVATEESAGTNPPGKFLRVSRATIANGQASAAEELGWTAASNLTAGCSPVFSSDAWSDQKGPNACWQSGTYLGAKLLVNIVGSNSEIKQITFESLASYMRLCDAAAQSRLSLSITSGFRTFQKQAELYRLFQAGGNRAAVPGRSNHQHGQAFDLNTLGFDGTAMYDWLKRNAPRLGFIRTVSGEHWHWEYLPDLAATLARQGKFATDRVRK
jgi:D-alanyl-D-alanine carboxypeptidase